MYIANTILSYPTKVEMSAQPFGWRTVDWSDFADANPDIAEDVALEIATVGHAIVGGGASPEITIRLGQ